MNDLDICFSPAQWRTLPAERLRASACAVIDVIRATSTIITALAHGAGVQAVASLDEAFALKAQNPGAVLAGERGGRAVPGFDLGNSPGDFTTERVQGRRVVLTTTNGTQALAACRGARAVVAAALLNLDAVAARLREIGPPWIIVCAGCEGGFGVDDAIVAGALAEALDRDHALVSLYHSVRMDLTETLLRSAAGRELIKVGLEKDVPFCAQLNRYSVVPTLGADGVLRGG
ncbi:MAG TPA: 2-phosphosulfolactate phosphatase [Candidatus Methylacidiphilales bacterium]|jgi:2-phosphosulfolactate phosphatase|nr:2-phosphosulfolactate phosphatase [Candidatus Methylacidiphilales bacterium]